MEAGKSAQKTEKASLRKLLRSGFYGPDRAVTKAKGSQDGMAALASLLSDRDASIRRNACWSLYKMLRGKHVVSMPTPPPEVFEALGRALGDKDPHVSHGAASALGGFLKAMDDGSVSRFALRQMLSPALPYMKKHGIATEGI
ncbi:MAG: HEAT repeat domain-containing protein [Candidatus Micrarchaeota archaeon]